jgi:hypothetical protein
MTPDLFARGKIFREIEEIVTPLELGTAAVIR